MTSRNTPSHPATRATSSTFFIARNPPLASLSTRCLNTIADRLRYGKSGDARRGLTEASRLDERSGESSESLIRGLTPNRIGWRPLKVRGQDRPCAHKEG